MATLLLRLSGPLQAWGTQSDFSNRDTGREPSKSGVIGLLCAALGRPRGAPVDDLAGLRMGVRVDREGVIRRDYHTAGKGGYYKVSGGVERSTLITSDRYYLADAKFLVGLEGDNDLLMTLQAALMRPAWLLFLGRKACIPAERVWLADGLQDAPLLDALTNYPWLGGTGQLPETLRLVIEDENGELVRNDQPLSFKPRRFVPRRMTRDVLTMHISKEEDE
jgi:CRISPR system Cascade subunit CasD